MSNNFRVLEVSLIALFLLSAIILLSPQNEPLQVTVFATSNNNEDENDEENEELEEQNEAIEDFKDDLQDQDHAVLQAIRAFINNALGITDPVCNCTAPGPTPGPEPNSTDPGPQPEPNVTEPESNGTQIILTPAMIKSLEGFGVYTNSTYLAKFNINNLIDNNVTSYWSQLGPSGFNLELNQPLKKVCSIEINDYYPKNKPYTITLDDKTFAGILNAKVVKNSFDCVTDVDKISMKFDTPKIWTTLGEFKLFSNGTTTEPPECPPGQVRNPVTGLCEPKPGPGPGTGNITSIEINNSNVSTAIKNSTVTFSLDDFTVIKIPDFDFNGTDPNGTDIDDNLTMIGGN